jgi:hypothetical protein
MASDLSYKLGRNPGHVPDGLRDLTWYVAGDLPAPPVRRVVPAPGKGDWGMDGNDRYGDCGVAGIHHGDMCVEYDTTTPRDSVTANEVVQYYLEYTGGQDNGVVLADFLAYVKKTGWFGHQLAGYAPVTINDMRTVQFTVNAYGFAYIGIQVTDLMMQASNAGKPWTPETFANGTVEGGHCVPVVGYGTENLYAVTWGKMQAIQYSAWHLIVQEAWAVLMSEIVAKGGNHGLNLAALQADLSKLTV